MNRDKIKNFLKEFISIQSVSTDPKRSKELERAAVFLKQKLEALGVKTKILQRDGAFPLVFGFLKGDPGRETIGIYGHYDVQPEDPLEEWKTDPFELSEANGKFWARGVADNKGHIVENIAAIEQLKEKGLLRNNFVFLFEGEEELGSPNFEFFLKEIREELRKVDVFFLTDVGMFEKNVPQIFYGLRGLVYFELEVLIGERDLHSGVYGNRVLNSAHILADFISKLKDPFTNRVLIKDFYSDVRKISEEERRLLKKIQRSEESELKEAGVFQLVSLDKENPSLTSKIYPSLDVNGLVSGFIGEGQKTIIPKKASVKFSCRLVEFQEPEKVERLIEEFVDSYFKDKGVEYKLKKYPSAKPFYTEINNRYIKKAAKTLSKVFGNETVFNRSGGTIPAAEIIQRLFGKPVVLTGFTLPDDNIHSPNENFDIDMFWKGIQALELLYS